MTTANEVATRSVPPELLGKVVIEGDLEKLSAAERMEYYGKVCDSLGLNPLTRPFDYIKLSGKLTLYAKKDATEQLAKMNHVSIKLQPGRSIEGVYLVQATASTEYRSVDATGAVPIESLKGESKANALMKAETKACRRAVLRLVGLGWLDETEVPSVSEATPILVDHTTGEIVEAPVTKQSPAVDPGAITVQQLKAIDVARKSAGMTAEEMLEYCQNTYSTGVRGLTPKQADEFITILENVPIEKEVIDDNNQDWPTTTTPVPRRDGDQARPG